MADSPDLPYEALQIVDPLTGMYFWWDEAPTAKRRVYHGQVAASLEGGYYLLAFAPCDELPKGVYEIVHVSIMTEQAWSFFQPEGDYLAAMGTNEPA